MSKITKINSDGILAPCHAYRFYVDYSNSETEAFPTLKMQTLSVKYSLVDKVIDVLFELDVHGKCESELTNFISGGSRTMYINRLTGGSETNHVVKVKLQCITECTVENDYAGMETLKASLKAKVVSFTIE